MTNGKTLLKSSLHNKEKTTNAKAEKLKKYQREQANTKKKNPNENAFKAKLIESEIQLKIDNPDYHGRLLVKRSEGRAT